MTPRQPDEILGPHPEHHAFGYHTQAEDTNTNSHLPHRALSQDSDSRDETVEQIREALIRHHASEEMRERDQRKRESLRQLGYPYPTRRRTDFRVPIKPERAIWPKCFSRNILLQARMPNCSYIASDTIPTSNSP